ncbi:dihydrodipicolinate synthase family protein [Sphingomonas sp. SRS2]|uniref:dihydrodipicolinate synthase family protein n=1 Tax=Sphingomonas sp. SRS2 TaxID=133190 RepID=UPI000618400A|nr:dihydrodipicolinate synthase family protein [Sphingomonas sp. SRS2]KKC25859.1 dihydrodipicolinate synthetase [Sphingomonas sp. SRS2]
MTSLRLPHGIYPYLVSPTDDEGRIDTAVLARLVDDLIHAGVDGLTPLGSTGEVIYLTQEQRRQVVETTLEAAAGRVPVVPGVAAFSIEDGVQQARTWQDLGAAGIVVMRQNGFATSEEGALTYFERIADAVSIPVVLYTNPALLGTDFTTAGLLRLAERPNIRYIKDATGDTGRILSLLNHVGDKLEIFSASAHIPAIVFLLGGVGWMAGPACVIPRAAKKLRDLVLAGDIDAALELQRTLWPINEAFRKYPLAACIKTALKLRGYAVGSPIAPQQPLGADAEREIEQALAAADAAVAP